MLNCLANTMYLSKLQKKILQVVKKHPGIRRRFLFSMLYPEVRTPPYYGRPKVSRSPIPKLDKEERALYQSKQAGLTRTLINLEQKQLIKLTRGSLSQLWPKNIQPQKVKLPGRHGRYSNLLDDYKKQ